jgi:protein-ribulosamine 3-kinase
MENLNEPIRRELETFLETRVHELRLSPVGGGCINNCYRAETEQGKKFFVKTNQAEKYPGLFDKEKNALSILAQQSIIRLPRVIATDSSGGSQYIILEWIESGKKSASFWKDFGTRLALLHKISSQTFGFFEDNYIGSLEQSNTYTPSWSEFFIQHRLEPQLKLAAGSKLIPVKQVALFEKIFNTLDNIFSKEPASLIHGDLWSGNFMCDQDSQPVLIDPAVYFGHRMMDIGMTKLFGGFDSRFYEAYNDTYPLPPNSDEQVEIANLYPLLIHLNLFGLQYLSQIETVLRRYT